jgi:O-methyltransferase
MNRITFHLTDGRWNWFARALPDLNLARALLVCRDQTMTTFPRCKTLWQICQGVFQRNVPGALVECGVWRGGSTGLMGLALRSHGQTRPVHLFDSFEGLPEPGPRDGAVAKDYSGGRAEGRLTPIARCDANQGHVRSFLLEQLKLDSNQVHFHRGWFQDTVPADAKGIGPIAVLRLDGDWYDSTKICLEHLYPLLSAGGAVIMDDYYCWEGCKTATDEYRTKHGITDPLIQVDNSCCYWIKT